MYETQANIGNTPIRKPVSVEVAEFAQNLANRAQDIADRVDGKLHSVMTSSTPRELVNACVKDSVEYPPLFSDLRINLQGIESALNSIEYAMSRTEL